MVNNGNNKNCGFEDVMVSYIYDEITTVERRKFETHLIDCIPCTDEFAEISGARFSVFEWQKEAFAELATPDIVIPYATSRTIAEASGLFAGLRGLFGGFGIPVSAAAAILIWLGIGFAAFTAMYPDDDDVIADVYPEQPKIQNVIVEKPFVKDDRVVVGESEVAADIVKESEQPRETRPTKVVAVPKPSRPARQLTADTTDRSKRMPQTRKAPALSNFDEVDDKSLRLTDLFADGGSGR